MLLSDQYLIIINPLTARVVGAPQMISQPVSSIFPCYPLSSGTGEFQACPFPDVVFPPLPLSALSSPPFHYAVSTGRRIRSWYYVSTALFSRLAEEKTFEAKAFGAIAFRANAAEAISFRDNKSEAISHY